jgi:hypothetical protein
MTALVASNVTVTLIQQRRIEARKHNKVQIAFGNGTLTYPAGGIPILGGAFGCPVNLESVVVYDSAGAGIHAEFDYTNQKLRLFNSAAHSHSLLLKNASVVDGTTTRVNAGTNLLGANTGSDITVAGGGANGGVQQAAAADLSEFATGFAVPATTLKAEIIGW